MVCGDGYPGPTSEEMDTSDFSQFPLTGSWMENPIWQVTRVLSTRCACASTYITSVTGAQPSESCMAFSSFEMDFAP